MDHSHHLPELDQIAERVLERPTAVQVAPALGPAKDEFTLPFGAVLSPQPLPGGKLPSHASPPSLCAKCEAFAAPNSAKLAGPGQWDCPFCMHTNPVPALLEDAADFVVAPEGAPHGPTEALRIIAFDLVASEESVDRLKEALLVALKDAPDHTRVGLVAYGQVASAFRLGPGGAGLGATADVLVPLEGSAEGAQPSIGDGTHAHTGTLGHCRAQLLQAARSLRYVLLRRILVCEMFDTSLTGINATAGPRARPSPMSSGWKQH